MPSAYERRKRPPTGKVGGRSGSVRIGTIHQYGQFTFGAPLSVELMPAVT